MEEHNQYCIPNKTLLLGARSAYEVINKELFNDELPRIPIKAQRLDDGLRYRTAAAFCIDIKHSVERLSIIINSKEVCFADFTAFLINTIGYLLHEMVHEYCYLHGITDVNHATQYHNSQFMLAAEEHGLVCDSYSDEFGFHKTLIKSDSAGDIVCKMPDEVLIKMMESITTNPNK